MPLSLVVFCITDSYDYLVLSFERESIPLGVKRKRSPDVSSCLSKLKISANIVQFCNSFGNTKIACKNIISQHSYIKDCISEDFRILASLYRNYKIDDMFRNYTSRKSHIFVNDRRRYMVNNIA